MVEGLVGPRALRSSFGGTYKDNQLLGVSLQSFSGYRKFPHINNTNDEFIVRISNQEAGDFRIEDIFTRNLGNGDFPNIRVIATTVMENIQSALDEYTVANGYAAGVLVNDTVNESDLTQRVTLQMVISETTPNAILRIQVLFFRSEVLSQTAF